MGAHSTIHVTQAAARRAFRLAINPNIPDTFFRDLGSENFEKLLDHILYDRLYNVVFVDQNTMDLKRLDPYARQFGNYDADGSEIRYHIGCAIEQKGFVFIRAKIESFGVSLSTFN